MNLKIVLILVLNCYLTLLDGQIIGTIKGQDAEILPFASIYLKNGSRGTTSNIDGKYELMLPAGQYQIVFQYTGYAKHIHVVEYDGIKLQLDIQLVPLIHELQEVVFSSKREDPAYDIIRAAIKNRKKYEFHHKNYECNSYSKGMFKVLDAPEKIFGTPLGNMNGNLDSNRQGILYLSEAVTHLEFNPPDVFHEKMIASKVAGSDNGFSINWASAISLNLYNNISSFGTGVISPIADYALNHYKYRLEGEFKDSDGYTYFKIKLIPKFEYDAVWQGHVYITDKEFSIYGFEGFVRGKQVKQEFFDTIFLRQEFIPLPEENTRKIQTQHYKVTGQFFGIKILGSFSLTFSDYIFGGEPAQKRKAEVFEVLPGANTKMLNYWDSVRTIPLTTEEMSNYHVKDSIKLYKSTPAYKDSMDQIRNQFKPINFLTGYNYSIAKRNFNFRSNSILEMVSFNPVQGLVVYPEFNFTKYLDRYFGFHRFTWTLNTNYGFSENRFRMMGRMAYHFDNVRKSVISLSGGTKISEFHNIDEINRNFNTLYSLYFKQNYLKLYDEKSVSLNYSTDLNYDQRITLSSGFYQRKDLFNQTNYSLAFYNKNYEPNQSVNSNDSALFIQSPNVWKTGIRWRLQPETKVWKTPEGVEKIGSVWPYLILQLQSLYYPDRTVGLGVFSANVGYTIEKTRAGEMEFYANFKTKIGKHVLDIPDRFYTNAIPFNFYLVPNSTNFSLGLNPYQIVGNRQLLELGFAWNLKGYFLDRIPLVNRLRWEELLRFHSVMDGQSGVYSEISFGFGNIGYKVFRLFRVDFVQTFFSDEAGPFYFKVGLFNLLSAG
ncbi:MAG: carboxypeptidase-like regulatory domain-containing protein [Saprospiraceae bacterium]|nr:carboxypeptidase-like regulatory domain-containing protein [Saprospiraceae bacterium]